MTEYDQPGITNPENVDGLTHQQIKDAFDMIQNVTHDMVINWGHAQANWQVSTTALLQAVRTAVDGSWTGAAADQAMVSVARYSGHAEELVDLFKETSSVVSSTATIAVMAKAFIPPVVPVTAVQKDDPVRYNEQLLEADTAQDEARRIMAERYIVGFMDQDSKLPTYPPALSPIADAPGVNSPVGTNPTSVSSAPTGTNPDGTPQTDEPSTETPQQNSPQQTQPATTDQQQSTNPAQSNPDSARTDSTRPASSSNPTAIPAAATRPDAISGTPVGTGGRSGGGSPVGTGGGNQSGGQPSPGVTRAPVPGTQPGLTPAAATSGTSAATSGRTGSPGMMPPGAARGKDDDREKSEKKVDLTHPSHVTELLGKKKYVPPVIGER